MPLEIKELHIRVSVGSASSGGGGEAPRPPATPTAPADWDAIIAACVEKVLEILKQKTER